MRQLVFLVALVGCSSSATLQESAGDAAATPPTAAQADADAPDAPDAPDAYVCTRTWQDSDAGAGWSMFGFVPQEPRPTEPYVCDTACGAGGPYVYSTQDPNVRPTEPAGCTRETASPTTWCCATLVCTRHANLDAFCKAGAYTKGYRCDGPDGGARPTRDGCILRDHPSAFGVEFCCLE